MKIKNYTGIIPSQYTGKEIESEATVALENTQAAVLFYNTAKQRLLQVNQWHEVAGAMSAKFQVVDESGMEAYRAAQQGDYLKINIPGPGNDDGDGFDWVLVEQMNEVAVQDEDVQSIGFRVRPVSNPTAASEHVAHFYDPAATSNFIVTREGNQVTASVIDRNLKPNDNAESLTDKIRDKVVGIIAVNSLSKVQWQNLAEGLVKMDG